MIDLRWCLVPPYRHQVIGANHVVDHPACALFDEMGLGKSFQTIIAAQHLYQQNELDRVVVITPAAVRAVWYDPELGELAKHLWAHIPARIAEYHKKIRSWLHGPVVDGQRMMRWTITNYDFIRNKERLAALMKVCNDKTMLILDESSVVKSWKAQQTKSCLKLRQKCGRVVLLNGTPIAHSPMDLFAQGNIMDPAILDCKYQIAFQSKYAIMGGFQAQTRFGKRPVQIVGWRNLDDLQARFAPYVLRRTKDQCLDLPPKLDSVPLTATLSDHSWKHYVSMRDEMVSWLSETSASMAAHAAIKVVRLSQITSGFLGGIISADGSADDDPRTVQFIGQEKLTVFCDWLTARLEDDPNIKVLVWTRFRAELFRLEHELRTLFPSVTYGSIYGAQKQDERTEALHLLDPRTAPKGPVVVAGIPASGSMGLNLTATNTVVYLSNDYNLKTRLQSEDRVHRYGQTKAVNYFDVITVGPKGQRTIDHRVLLALKNKQSVADFTVREWMQALSEE